MASLTSPQPPSAHSPEKHLFFDSTTERQLLLEDSTAWKSVTGILLAIVSMGLAIAISSLLLIGL